MSQEKIILLYLKNLGEWKLEYEIRCMRTPEGYWIGARGDRTVRDLITKELVDIDMRGKYRIVKHKIPKSTQNINESTQRSQQVLFVK